MASFMAAVIRVNDRIRVVAWTGGVDPILTALSSTCAFAQGRVGIALLTVVVLFLARCDDEFRAGRFRSLLGRERSGLLAPGPYQLERLELGHLGYWDEFLSCFRIHRSDDDRFARAGPDPEEDTADLSWGGGRRGRSHSQFSVRLHIIERVYGAIPVFQ